MASKDKTATKEKAPATNGKAKKPELTPEEKKAQEKERIDSMKRAIKIAYSLPTKNDQKGILKQLGGKLPVSELNAMVEKGDIDESFRDLCVEMGLQRSAATRTGVSHALPFGWKSFAFYVDDDGKAVQGKEKLISVVTDLYKSHEEWIKQHEKDFTLISGETGGWEFSHYFRIPDDCEAGIAKAAAKKQREKEKKAKEAKEAKEAAK